MSETKIEWATHTANWLAGCTKISPACQHCYAETMTARLATMPHAPARYREGVVSDRRWTGRIAYDADALRAAFDGLRNAKSPRRVFCNSMSDTFHADAPPESLADLAHAIRGLNQEYLLTELPGRKGSFGEPRVHSVIMLLTKRPDLLLAWQREHFPDGLPPWVWVGCTVEDQRRADERIPSLLEVRAEVRFLSCEPLLGPIRLDYVEHPDGSWWGYLAGMDGDQTGYGMGGRTGGLSWIIVGGESGPGARPMHPEWARSLRDQCASAGVPFFMKQMSSPNKHDIPDDLLIRQIPGGAA